MKSWKYSSDNYNTTYMATKTTKERSTPTTPRHLCLSLSKRNQRYLDLIDDYALEFNQNKCQTVFRIIREYNTYRCLDSAR